MSQTDNYFRAKIVCTLHKTLLGFVCREGKTLRKTLQNDLQQNEDWAALPVKWMKITGKREKKGGTGTHQESENSTKQNITCKIKLTKICSSGIFFLIHVSAGKINFHWILKWNESLNPYIKACANTGDYPNKVY